MFFWRAAGKTGKRLSNVILIVTNNNKKRALKTEDAN